MEMFMGNSVVFFFGAYFKFSFCRKKEKKQRPLSVNCEVIRLF